MPNNIPMFNPTGAGGNMFNINNALGQSGGAQLPGFGGYNPYATSGGGSIYQSAFPMDYNYGTSGNVAGLPSWLQPQQGGASLPSGPAGNYGGGYGGANTGMGNPGSVLPASFGKGISKDFGSGLGSGITAFLGSGAGFNPNVVNALWNSLQPQIARNLATIDSASGVSGTRFGSAHDFATSDYLSQVTANMGATEAQMYQHSNDLIAQMLMSMINPTAQINMSEPGIMDYIGGALGVAGSVAGLAGGFGVPGFGGFKPK